MKPFLSPDEEREEKKRKEAYEKHKCKGCVYASWQKKDVVLCLFAKCVKEKGWK